MKSETEIVAKIDSELSACEKYEAHMATTRPHDTHWQNRHEGIVYTLQSLRDWITSSATGGAKEGE